jgi:hypothetical protein
MNYTNPHLDELESLVIEISTGESRPKYSKKLDQLLEPILSWGCVYDSWVAAFILATGAGTGYVFPNALLLNTAHRKVYNHCHLGDFTEEQLSKGFRQ